MTTDAKPITINVLKYVYLAAFFALLSGVFHPLINNNPLDQVVQGVLVLALGVVGGILLYKVPTSRKYRGILLGSGLGLIAISLTLVFTMTGRF